MKNIVRIIICSSLIVVSLLCSVFGYITFVSRTALTVEEKQFLTDLSSIITKNNNIVKLQNAGTNFTTNVDDHNLVVSYANNITSGNVTYYYKNNSLKGTYDKNNAYEKLIMKTVIDSVSVYHGQPQESTYNIFDNELTSYEFKNGLECSEKSGKTDCLINTKTHLIIKQATESKDLPSNLSLVNILSEIEKNYKDTQSYSELNNLYNITTSVNDNIIVFNFEGNQSTNLTDKLSLKFILNNGIISLESDINNANATFLSDTLFSDIIEIIGGMEGYDRKLISRTINSFDLNTYTIEKNGFELSQIQEKNTYRISLVNKLMFPSIDNVVLEISDYEQLSESFKYASGLIYLFKGNMIIYSNKPQNELYFFEYNKNGKNTVESIKNLMRYKYSDNSEKLNNILNLLNDVNSQVIDNIEIIKVTDLESDSIINSLKTTVLDYKDYSVVKVIIK